MKTSIIVVCHNVLECTIRCVESVFSYTKDFELIIVDNASTDGTIGYLKELEKKENVKVIYNPENYSFSKANNQGLAIASGEYICFLNNDCIVKPFWLDRMFDHWKNVSLENIGMIGPVSCNSNGTQNVGMQDSEKWFEEHKGEYHQAGILYGWCMLTKKQLLDEIGSFDERFHNAYEDNDLCLRYQIAGYKLICAYDTYIDHIGQQTFLKKLNSEKYNDNGSINREIYFDKWYSDKRRKLVAVYRTNGGKYLEKSLEQTSKFADHILVNLCRAPEETINIVKKFPKVRLINKYDGTLQENAEREFLLQEALKLNAKGEADWCISIDDDEIYEDDFIEKVQGMMNPRNPEIFGYWCQWRTIWNQFGDDQYYRADSTFGSFSNYRFFRLMKNQHIPSGNVQGFHCGSAPIIPSQNLRWSKIRVKHLGYDTYEQRKKKFDWYQKTDLFKTKQDIGYDDYSHLVEYNVKLNKWRDHNRVSLCMMVKNEQEYLQGCLEHIEPFVDEIIIADTGSEDKTIEIIENFKKYSSIPVLFLRIPWVDNYSITRNYIKQFAKGDWILHLDADERFTFGHLSELYKMVEDTTTDAIIFHVLNYLEHQTKTNLKPKYASTESIRLFRNIPEFYYTGVIHETFDDALSFMRRHRKVNIVKAKDFPLHHFGYLKKRAVVKNKMDYYEQLNKKQIEITDGRDPRPYFNLALHYLNDDKQNDAVNNFKIALELYPNFWHASQQMAALNIKAAKGFLLKCIESLPQSHPFHKEAADIYSFLNSKSFGSVKVT